MEQLDTLLKAVEQARRRKKELKKLIEVLFDEYKLVKTEVRMHEQQIEELMQEKEYSEYLDTLQPETSFEFQVFSDREPGDKK
jgi:hypothetical protein